MICEKCGYTYEKDSCPVCNAVAERKLKLNEKKSALGVVGMIMSIISCGIKVIIPFIPSIPISIASLILSIIGAVKNKKDGFAVTGICVSSANIVLRIIVKAIKVVLDILITAFVLIFLFFALIIIIGLLYQIPISDVDSVF